MALFRKVNDKIPKRGILGAMMFLACMFSYMIRTNLSITIVAMVNTTSKDGDSGPACSAVPLGNVTHKTAELKNYGERFEWNQHVQGLLLSGYFYGVLPASVPAGLLAEKYGGSKVVAFATLIPAVLNLLMPWASGLHYGFVFALRFLMGFFGGAVYPALHAMIARWVPPSEKGMFVWTMQGGPFGTVVTFALCGQIISALGWKAAYYVTSGLILIFYALWVYLIYDTPDLHPGMTEKERNYIREQIGTTVSKEKKKLPAVAALTSVPFLVLLWAHFANMWGIYFIATNGPKYTLEVLGFDMKSGGSLTGLPYIARLGAGVLFAAAGDYVRRRNFLSLVWIRKIFMIFSHMGPAVALVIMTYAGCDSVTAIVMLIVALTFNGAACQTSLQNHQDLAPNFAGSLYGIMNTIGSFPGFIIPPIIGALTNERNGVEEWRIMFWISAAVFTSATVFFWLFGSADIQPWNDVTEPKVTNLSEEEKQMTEIPIKELQTEDESENERL
ncbi:sialin [Nomia melanderi]|uniref:sialin n=1 Tax=Nomia melanderi TaxID=2448451 RepID=UPI001304447A|nr:sialin-like [Nomia melanderi]XP_031833180.1 sialin-like [Nomia melanderi]XP_031833182.1 sialin-like [Nomia melanderi]XP_031833183.1 sialin-like [Nomia melanderi]